MRLALLLHGLAGGIGLRASYVGQRNVGNLGSPNINQPLPAPGAVQPLRVYQPFANITLNNDPIFQSTTRELQGGIEKRYSNGLLVTAQYQFTRALGTETYQSPTNYNDSRGNLSGIRRDVFTASYVYDLPFGTGRMLFNGASGLEARLISGWQLSGLISALSGSPFSPSFTTSVQGSVGGRPNVVAGAALYPSNRTINESFNPAAFVAPANYTFGNAGYYILWGPGQQNWDIGLAKNTFGNPSANITNTATVGKITSAGGNGTIQIGGKLTF